MKVEIATLCNYASDRGGLLTIVEAFDTIVASKLPCKPAFYFAAKVAEAGKPEEPDGTHAIKISVVKADGNDEVIFNTSGSLHYKEQVMKYNIVMNFNGLLFKSVGDYVIRISIDDENVVEHRFNVKMRT